MKALQVLHGDNRETLKKQPPGSIHAFITSPPYWSVRDYKTPPVSYPAMRFQPAIGLPQLRVPAWEGQLGLEPDPWAYIGHLVLCFRAAARVLRSDGTLWVNIGDTWNRGDATDGTRNRPAAKLTRYSAPNSRSGTGYKPKDLVGIPWMLAKALQADGWTLRSEVIWHKPTAMPQSARDRPSLAHEQLFLFSRGERYFYDQEAVKEPTTGTANARGNGANPKTKAPTGWDTGPGSHNDMAGRYPKARQNESFSQAVTRVMKLRNRRTVWSIPAEPYTGAHFATFPTGLVRPCILASTSEKGACPLCGAQWERVTVPPPRDAEYADPRTVGWQPTCVCGSAPELDLQPDDMQAIETPTGEQLGDNTEIEGNQRFRDSTGRGIRRLTKYEHRKYAEQIRDNCFRPEMSAQAFDAGGPHAFDHYLRTDANGARPIPPELLKAWIANGWMEEVRLPIWKPPAPVPCRVGDLFAGSGTVGQVAREYGRHALLCELAGHYLPLIEQRTDVTPALPNLA